MEPESRRPSSWIRRAIGKLLPPATPQPEDRESIWSISRQDARTFFRLVGVLWIAGLAYSGHRARHEPTAAWNTATAEAGGPWPHHVGDFVMAALSDFSGVAIAIAIIAMLLTRPLNLTGELIMSLYQAMVNRFVVPVIEAHEARGRAEGVEIGRSKGVEIGRAEGEEIGRAEGEEIGRAAERTEWQEWNRRRMDAEAQGRPFDEPPPGD